MAIGIQDIPATGIDKIQAYLGDDADHLLHYEAKVSKHLLNLPGPDFIDRIFAVSDRSIPVLNNLQRLYGSGRLAGTGYVSILPIDQGIEHSGGASFAPNPIYFDPENIVKLAIEGGCNADFRPGRAGLEHGLRGRRRHDLLWLGRVQPPDC
jgi:class I fructose-bisphosphate aldolase